MKAIVLASSGTPILSAANEQEALGNATSMSFLQIA
jgi:hypothetical protein